jgi:4-amino-4-deoxy-L-arabinose transferase-like glycosyltransferase
MTRETHWLVRHSSKAFWALLLLHLVCWTLVPALTQPNAPLDVIEGFVWGHEWLLGTYKHPPLQAWLLESATYLTGNSGFGYFGLSALCGAIALWSVFRTGRLFVSKEKALLATLLAQVIFYLNLLSTEFNPNVLQLALAALCTYAFAHGLMHGKIKYWIMLGIFFALGLYAKYSFALFGLSFLLPLIVIREARSFLFSARSYMALMTAFLLFMPHLMWLTANQFLPFSYAMERVEMAQFWWQYIWFPAKFFASQLLAMLPALLLGGILFFPFVREAENGKIKQRLLFLLAFAPLIVALAISGFSGQKLRDMWGMPLLTFIPLWLVATFRLPENRLTIFAKSWGLCALLCLGAFAFNLLFAPSLGFKPLRGHFPGRDISAYLYQQWQGVAGDKSLNYVVGDAWMAGNVAFYAPDTRTRPHVWIDAGNKTSPWIDRDSVRRHGAIVLWRVENPLKAAPPPWAAEFRSLKMQKAVIFPWKTGTAANPVIVGWGLIKPE